MEEAQAVPISADCLSVRWPTSMRDEGMVDRGEGDAGKRGASAELHPRSIETRKLIEATKLHL